MTEVKHDRKASASALKKDCIQMNKNVYQKVKTKTLDDWSSYLKNPEVCSDKYQFVSHWFGSRRIRTHEIQILGPTKMGNRHSSQSIILYYLPMSGVLIPVDSKQ